MLAIWTNLSVHNNSNVLLKQTTLIRETNVQWCTYFMVISCINDGWLMCEPQFSGIWLNTTWGISHTVLYFIVIEECVYVCVQLSHWCLMRTESQDWIPLNIYPQVCWIRNYRTFSFWLEASAERVIHAEIFHYSGPVEISS